MRDKDVDKSLNLKSHPDLPKEYLQFSTNDSSLQFPDFRYDLFLNAKSNADPFIKTKDISLQNSKSRKDVSNLI